MFTFFCYLKTQKNSYYFVTSIASLLLFKKRKSEKIVSMAEKKLGEYATPNDDYLRAPITQPAVTAENYEIKPHFLNLVQ